MTSVFSDHHQPLPLIALGALGLLLEAAPAAAQAQSRGDASLRIEYQYIRTGDFYDDSALFQQGGDVGTTDSHVLLLSGDYALGPRWTVFASLPYIQKQHQGTGPHNFAEFVNFDPPDRTLVDDGDYHGGFQDLTVGVRYHALEGPLSVTPFISYGVPTTDYPFYGKAIIGPNLWRVPIGVDFGFQPYFSDWYFGASVAYVISEQSLGVNVNHWLAFGSAGYYFTPRFFASLFVSYKNTPNGLRMPQDITDDPLYGNPADFDTPIWWQHDRLLAHRYTNVGLGLDYVLTQRNVVSFQYYTGVYTDQSNEVDNAFTLGITRYFGRD
ncbi:transporter [Thioalkalivibrio sp. XN8]|uniref:transporter n=1 Tax=Thioalkalivibrio sp. XN8 TaxID=2712863 RepID=UPI0013EC2302|nr:transporter [Thioalkalivibrio sp. XN8]NGP53182.1 transporter [Thioalkalivibrio sp. XN8]